MILQLYYYGAKVFRQIVVLKFTVYGEHGDGTEKAVFAEGENVADVPPFCASIVGNMWRFRHAGLETWSLLARTNCCIDDCLNI
jgi:hypothetical protein